MILDGGRSALRGTDLEEALDCIRCGACLYSCPMWRSVGGQTYGSPYSGPIGAVLTPLLEGMRGRALERAAVHVVALRRLPRRLPGGHPAARPARAGARPGDDGRPPPRPRCASGCGAARGAARSPTGRPSALARLGPARAPAAAAGRGACPGRAPTGPPSATCPPVGRRRRSARRRDPGRARPAAGDGRARAARPASRAAAVARADEWGVERARCSADDPVLATLAVSTRPSAPTAARCSAGPTGAGAAGASCSDWRDRS